MAAKVPCQGPAHLTPMLARVGLPRGSLYVAYVKSQNG